MKRGNSLGGAPLKEARSKRKTKVDWTVKPGNIAWGESEIEASDKGGLGEALLEAARSKRQTV